MKIKTKKEQVAKHLKSGKSLTQKQAIEKFGSYRLSSIIHDLRHIEGMSIKSILMQSKNKETGHASNFVKYKIHK